MAGADAEMRLMTTRSDRASREEAEVLAAWRSAREACHKQELHYYATRDAEIDALAREHFAAVQALITELQGGTLTYGEFSRRRIELYQKVNSRIERVRKDVLPPKLPPPPGGYGK